MSAGRKALFAAAFVVATLITKRKKQRRKVWVKEWIQRRSKFGAYENLLSELKIEDSQQFVNFIRMSAADFEILLQMIAPKINKRDTHLRSAISPSERLMVTLRFLATGDSYHSLMYLFRIPVCTISGIVPEVCAALYQVLKNGFLQMPKTGEEWLYHAKMFEEIWNFPHCIGALDGKYVVIQAPKSSGSYYFNYKGTHSIVLMALVDACYRILYMNVGCNGRVSNGGVFNNCSLSHALENNSVGLPPPSPLRSREMPVPYVVLADDAFAMKPYLIKPYPFRDQPAPNRVFNYRLSRARRIVENVFGIMPNKFCVLRKPIELGPGKVEVIVSAICVLHNFLISQKDSCYKYASNGMFDTEDQDTRSVLPGSWREEGMPEGYLLPLQQGIQHNSGVSAKGIRDEFKNYFLSQTPSTEAEWQEVERGFADKWNFPGCFGALGGKHIVMKKPAHGASMFYSYKGALSVILMAVVDSDYSFRYIDVEASGISSDGGMFQNCSLKEAVDSKSLNMPDSCFFVADDAFPMKPYLLKPFLRNTPLTSKELVFNYRLSRARLIVENAFGILASRFRVFEKPISLGPEKVNKVVLATCALHNWLKISTRSHYLPPGSVDVEDIKTGTVIPGSWRQVVTDGSALRDLERLESDNYSKQAAARRYAYASYFMGEGVVPWQMQMIHSGTLNQ